MFPEKARNEESGRWLFRVIDPAFPKNNIYRVSAKQMVSLGPVMVASTAKEWCIDNDKSWLTAEVINENNYRSVHRRAPIDPKGMPDHLVLQQERYAAFIGISCSMTTGAPRAIELIRFYKGLSESLRPKAIIVGGWHALDNPQEMLEAGADVVVHGEVEIIIKNLLIALRNGESLSGIPGISYWSGNHVKRNGPTEIYVPQEMMDKLPDPDFGLVRYSVINIFPLGRTRGCDGKCPFCRVKCQPRSISPQRFLEQIIVLISKGAHHIFIVDDRSEQDLDGFIYWLKGLGEFIRIRRPRISITTQNRLSLAEHPEVLQLMRDARVTNVAIGYESPIAEQLAAMQKPIKPGEMLNYTKIWKKYDFAVHMMLIFGYPLSPKAKEYLIRHGRKLRWSAKELGKIFWKFIKEAKPHTLQVLLYTPLPGTEDRKFLEEEGRILPLGWEFYDGTWLLFEPDEGIVAKEIQKEFIKLLRKFYAFNFLWPLRFVPLLIHYLNVGLITISYPFIRPIIGARSWGRIWWNSLHRLYGHLIVWDWLKNFRRSKFIEKLTEKLK